MGAKRLINPGDLEKMINMDSLGEDELMQIGKNRELLHIIWESGDLVQILWVQITNECKLSGKMINFCIFAGQID